MCFCDIFNLIFKNAEPGIVMKSHFLKAQNELKKDDFCIIFGFIFGIKIEAEIRLKILFSAMVAAIFGPFLSSKIALKLDHFCSIFDLFFSFKIVIS